MLETNFTNYGLSSAEIHTSKEISAFEEEHNGQSECFLISGGLTPIIFRRILYLSPKKKQVEVFLITMVITSASNIQYIDVGETESRRYIKIEIFLLLILDL